MSPWWLALIVPFCGAIGFVGCAVLSAGKRADESAARAAEMHRTHLKVLKTIARPRIHGDMTPQDVMNRDIIEAHLRNGTQFQVRAPAPKEAA